MKTLNQFITEKFNTDSVEDYLASIVNSAKAKPDIYDDTEYWEASDGFEYWESAWGERDDVKEFISEYCDRKCVAGWSTEESFEETEKVIPKMMKYIMNKVKSKMPYKKRNNHMDVWETTQDGFDITILKFKNYANDNGTDYTQFWFMIAIE